MKSNLLAILLIVALGASQVISTVEAYSLGWNNNNKYMNEDKAKALAKFYPKFKVKPLPANNTTQCCGGTQNFYPYTTGLTAVVSPVAAPGTSGTQCYAIYNATGPVTISELNLQGWAVTRNAMPLATDQRILSVALYHKEFQQSNPLMQIPINSIIQPTITDGSNTLWLQWFSSTCERDSFPFEYSTVRDPLFSQLRMNAQDQLLLCAVGVNSDAATFSDSFGWSISAQFSYIFTFP